MKLNSGAYTWTDEENDVLRKYYYDTPWPELLKLLPGRTISGCYGQSGKLGLKRLNGGKFLKGIRRSPGTEFKKGQTPINKGKKQIEYMTPEGIERSKATRFKKGQVSHNMKHDYAMSKRHHHGRPYMYIRIGLGKWQEFHRWLWMEKHGQIPKDKIVVFKDRDSMNCTIENLELISKVENMKRNSIMRWKELNPEVFKARVAVSALKKTITLKKRNKYGKAQNEH